MNMLIAFFVTVAHAQVATTPVPLPIFLKEGFTTVLEFDEPAVQVVLGDQGQFQVERVGKAIAIRPLSSYALTNLFVYFKKSGPRLFILNASEEAEPLHYKRFNSLTSESKKSLVFEKPRIRARRIMLVKSEFSRGNDFLTLNLVVSADSQSKLSPNWSAIDLIYNGKRIRPIKVWSSRREVQRDSQVQAQLNFVQPNVPTSLKNTTLAVPLLNEQKVIVLDLGKGKR